MKAIVAGTSHSSSQMQTTLPQLARQVKLSLVLRAVDDEAVLWYIIVMVMPSISSWLSKNGNFIVWTTKFCILLLNKQLVMVDLNFSCRLAFRYLEQFSEFLPTLTCAYSLTKLLVAVCKACKADQIRHSIGQWSCD